MATRRSASRGSVTGAITDLQRRIRLLQSKSVPTRLANQVVARSAIQPRAVSTDQIALDAVTNDQIAADAIKREQIDVGAVGTTEIDNLAVTTDKIGDEAVVEGKIGEEAVVEGKIGPLAVTNAKLQDAAVQLRNMTPNSVQNNALLTNSVNFRTIAVNAVGNENMLDNAVGNAELQNNSVAQSNLRNDSVGFAELRGSSVGTSTLQTGAVTRSKIGSGQVGTTQIENRAVTGAKIALGTVTTGNIDTSSQINIARRTTAGSGLTRSFTAGGQQISANASAIARASVFGTASIGRETNQFGVAFFTNFGDESFQSARGNHRHTQSAFSGGTTSEPISSSARFKKDISNYNFNDPQRLLSLQLKKFKYIKSLHHKDTNKEWFYGYIAEEVADLGIEEMVIFDEKGRPSALDYQMLSIFVLELVKTQQKEIENLKEKLGETE